MAKRQGASSIENRWWQPPNQPLCLLLFSNSSFLPSFLFPFFPFSVSPSFSPRFLRLADPFVPTRSSGSAFSTKRSHPPASNLPLALVLSPLCRRVCGYFESKFAHPQFRIELRLSRGKRGRRTRERISNCIRGALSLSLPLSSPFSVWSRKENRITKGRKMPFLPPIVSELFTPFHGYFLLLRSFDPPPPPPSVYDRVLPRGILEWICFI